MNPDWTTIEQQFNVRIQDTTFIRGQIGRVYQVTTDQGAFALKWYRAGWDTVARQSAEVMAHLNKTTAYAPVLRRTTTNDVVATMDGTSVVVWEWVTGKDVDKEIDATALHDLWYGVNDTMADMEAALPKRTLPEHVERYLACLREIDWSPTRTEQLRQWSRQWIEAVERLPSGFQHGDFHSGNVLRTDNGLVLLDFDACGLGSPLVDMATMYDAIPFHDCTDEGIETTLREWDRRFHPDPVWIDGLLAALPLRHMEIIANILLVHGVSERNQDLFDKQYRWMERFQRVWTSRFHRED
jgi:Ser/Thr protein kinase RdoA (MazF antagonist)